MLYLRKQIYLEAHQLVKSFFKFLTNFLKKDRRAEIYDRMESIKCHH